MHKFLRKINNVKIKNLSNLQCKYYEPDSNQKSKFLPVNILNNRNLWRLQKVSLYNHVSTEIQAAKTIPLFFQTRLFLMDCPWLERQVEVCIQLLQYHYLNKTYFFISLTKTSLGIRIWRGEWVQDHCFKRENDVLTHHLAAFVWRLPEKSLVSQNARDGSS